FCSLEFNASIPTLLKNTIDWVSRISSDGDKPFRPYAGLTVGLCSSSDGVFAGMRGLYHLRAVLMNVGVQIVTEQCSVGHASVAFNEDGTDRKSTRLNSSHVKISYAVFCLKKKKIIKRRANVKTK